MILKILNTSIPVSFTLVNSSNNTLIINGVTYTLTNGNYNANTLLTELTTILGSSYQVTYNNTTNKYTFSSSSNFTISKTSTCLKLLGFPTGSDSTSSANALTSNYNVDVSGDNVIYIDIANFSTNNLSSSTSSRTSVVKSILNNVAYGGVLFVEDNGTTPITLQEDHLSFVHVRLFGEDCATLLDFSNTNWQMTLEIGFTPKQIQPSLALPFQDLYQQYIDKLHGK